MKPKIDLKPYIIAGIISLLVGTFVFILFFIMLKWAALDGVGFATIILFSLAGFMWVTREGFFDIFAYGFRQLGSSIFSKKPNEYNDYGTYKEYKFEIRKKRAKYYISIALVGCLFLIATIVLLIIYKL